MRTAIIFLLIAATLLLFLFYQFAFWFGSTTIDIHVHDTKYVFPISHLVIEIILILAIFFTLGGMIGTRFKKRSFVISFIIVFVLHAFYIGSFVYRFNEMARNAGF